MRQIPAVALSLICALYLTSCARFTDPTKPNRHEKAAINEVADLVRDKLIDESSFSQGFAGQVFRFEYGEIADGVAVLLVSSAKIPHGDAQELDCAFWVVGDKVYAVNSNAKELVPDLEQAPEGIDYAAVRSVVR